MKQVYLFPGQGAQYPGMGKDLWENSPLVKELFIKASQIVGMDMTKLLFQGTEEELKATNVAQAAITLMNLSVSTALKEHEIRPTAVAGFSLGEYAALSEAGVLSQEDVFRLVQLRGSLMEKASRKWDSSDGPAGMAAVLGIGSSKVEEVLQGLEDIYIANYNSPIQTVISGTARGLSSAEEKLKQAGAKRIIRLKVSGPFHSPLLKEAKDQFEEALKVVPFQDPNIPVYSNVTGKEIPGGEDARMLAGLHIVSPVRWVMVEEQVYSGGYNTVLEAGPGSVLTGLWKALYSQPHCVPLGTWEEIQCYIEQIHSMGR